VGKKSRDKGYRGEHEWVQELLGMGIQAWRVPLSGAVRGFEGDVVAKLSMGDVTWSVKRRKKLPKWLKELPAAIREDYGDWIILLPLDLFRALVVK
jgi:hypothetical protein